jgi:hypothetical protein
MKQKYSMMKEISAFTAGMKLKRHLHHDKRNAIIFAIEEEKEIY